MKASYSLILAVVLAAGYATQTEAQPSPDASQREIFGKIGSIEGSRLTIRTRTGTVVQVDASAATAGGRSTPLVVGRAVDIVGMIDAAGTLHAERIMRAKESPALWPPDR